MVLNRANSPISWWGNDIVEVCLWPYQFSCWNDSDPNNKIMLRAENINDKEFKECLEVAKAAVLGALTDNTFNSTHYINPAVASPAWARGLEPVLTIKDHTFFNNVP